MSEFFLELFSEEIPANLQKNFREKLLEEFREYFINKSIKSKKSFSLSTPNRVIIVFEGLQKKIKVGSEEIKGPKTSAPVEAIEGFLRSNKIDKKQLIKCDTEKGEFYFFKTPSKTLNTSDLLKVKLFVADRDTIIDLYGTRGLISPKSYFTFNGLFFSYTPW